MSDSNDQLPRRKLLKHSAVAVGGLAGASGAASAGGKGKKQKKKRKKAKAGWTLVPKKFACKKLKKGRYKSFKVLYKTSTKKYPAGCSPNSSKKRYVGYKVRFKNKKGKTFKTIIYRRKNQPQLKKGANYRVKKVKRCGKNCRVHFKRQKNLA